MNDPAAAVAKDSFLAHLGRRGWLPLVVFAGVGARFWAGTFPSNYDFESYRIVVGIVEQGGNVWANTFRYNYGPVWFMILHLLDVLARHDLLALRRFLTGFLTLVDLGIFYILWRKFGRLAATLFFLNPVSGMITGFQSQFDNVAVLLGLVAVLLYGDDFEKPVRRRKAVGLAVLGLSLMTKHILFAFPLWLAVKQQGRLQKLLVLLVPVGIFFASFAPYWAGGHAGIVEHVFAYKSFPAAYLFKMLVPTLIQYPLDAKTFWLLLLVLFAFLHRKKTGIESLLWYTAVMLAASPGITNEYLAIPLVFTSVYVNFFTLAYSVIATCHICGDADGPPLLAPQSGGIADLAIYALWLAVIWGTWRNFLLGLLEKCRDEVVRQFRGEA